MIVNLRLEHVEARARLIRLLIADTAARELIKVLARIHPLPHERHHPLRGFLAGFRVAQTLLAIPLSDTGLVLQSKSYSLSFFFFFHIVSLQLNPEGLGGTILDLEPYGRSLIDTKEIRGGVNMYYIARR